MGISLRKGANKLVTILGIGLLSACATTQPATQVQNDDWFGNDKYTHFLVTTAMSAGIAKAAKNDGMDSCDAAKVGFAITMTIGAAKESYDKRRKKTLYSYRDMVWNTAGATLGSLMGSNCH